MTEAPAAPYPFDLDDFQRRAIAALDAGWSVRFTPAVEVIHEVGVSTGGDRRPHRLVVMHSISLYRYYAKQRAAGWRRITLPLAWAALRLRAEIAWLRGRIANR